MSISIEVACLQCKVIYTIGQGSGEADVDSDGKLAHRWNSFIYTSERKTMKNFNSFINEHVMRCHKVILCSDGDGDPYADKLHTMTEYVPLKKKKVG